MKLTAAVLWLSLTDRVGGHVGERLDLEVVKGSERAVLDMFRKARVHEYVDRSEDLANERDTGE